MLKPIDTYQPTLLVMTLKFYDHLVITPKLYQDPIHYHDTQVFSTPRQLPLLMTPKLLVCQNQEKFSHILLSNVAFCFI